MPFEGVVKIPIYISKAFISKKVNLP